MAAAAALSLLAALNTALHGAENQEQLQKSALGVPVECDSKWAAPSCRALAAPALALAA